MALVAASVVLSNVAVIAILEYARQGELQTARVNAAIERIASVFRYTASIPRAERAAAVRALSGNLFRYSISTFRPFSNQSMDEEEKRIAVHLREGERNDKFSSASVRLTHTKRPTFDNDGPALEIVQALSSGHEWLSARFNRPPTPSPAPAIILAATLGSILTGAAAGLLAGRVSRPLLDLGHAADEVARGRPAPQLSCEGPEDMKRAAVAFNAMSQRVACALDKQRKLLSAVGHDLRTPLAAMRITAEFIDDEKVRGCFMRNLDELQALTEAVLSAARSGTSEESRRVDLASLIESVSDDLVENGFSVDVSVQGLAPCNCRPNEIRRVVRNLLLNAVRYGVSARVSLRGERDAFIMTVEDDGPGIPEDRLEEVFEPFVRLEESRNSATGGAGLGLTHARSIARDHGGDIMLENRRRAGQNIGLRASLRLPRERTGGTGEAAIKIMRSRNTATG